MFITAFLSIAGLGFICWLLFNLAVYALPFFAGVSVGMFAYETGAGPIGAIAVGLIAGAVTLVVGQVLFATIRSPALRAVIAILFAAPAALAGYHAVYGVTGIGDMAEIWRQAFGVVASAISGFVAWSRMSAFYPSNSGQGVGTRQESPPSSVLRCAPGLRLRRRSPPALRSPSRPRWARVRDNEDRRLSWRPSAPSRSPATTTPAKSSL